MHVPELLSRIGGVASTAQLAEHGCGAAEITRAVRVGSVLRVRRGWVALPSAPAAAIAAVRVGGTVSCISVLRPLDVWCVRDRRLHVRVGSSAGTLASPRDRRVPLENAARHGIVIHRSRWPARSPTAGAPAVDDLATALRHAVVCQARDDAVGSLDSALNGGLIRLSDLREALSPLPLSYRSLLDLVDGRADSGVETKARLGLRAVNIACRTQVAIPGVGNVDLLVGERLVIELDGEEWHAVSEAFAEDRRRDLLLAGLGYRVLRLTYTQVMYQWPSVLATVRGLIAAREHHWPRVGGDSGSLRRV